MDRINTKTNKHQPNKTHETETESNIVDTRADRACVSIRVLLSHHHILRHARPVALRMRGMDSTRMRHSDQRAGLEFRLESELYHRKQRISGVFNPVLERLCPVPGHLGKNL